MALAVNPAEDNHANYAIYPRMSVHAGIFSPALPIISGYADFKRQKGGYYIAKSKSIRKQAGNS